MVARFNDRGITFLVAGEQASLACYVLRDGRGWTENLRLTPDGQAEMPALPRTRSATGSIKASNELGIAGSFLAPLLAHFGEAIQYKIKSRFSSFLLPVVSFSQFE